MKTIGSQRRETLSEAGYEVAERVSADTVLLKDKETGKLETWVVNDDFAGYVVEIDGVGYEFVSSVNTQQ